MGKYDAIAKNIQEKICEDVVVGCSDFDYANTYDEIIEQGITSPPEQLFYACWINHPSYHETFISLFPQKKIGSFFMDFETSIISYFINNTRLENETLKEIWSACPLVGIEIDGHEWHEKTKEQVAKDKKRERYIVSQGYRVFRFSAKQVLDDVCSSCNEIFDFCVPILEGLKKKYEVQIIDAEIEYLKKKKERIIIERGL